MKAARIVAAIFVVLAIIALVVHRYRDGIALEVANAALGSDDVRVTDVSVESIGTERVRFRSIVLELRGGTIVRLGQVALPVRFRGFAGSTLQLGSVQVTPPDDDTEPPRVAALLHSYLDAPALMPGATVEVGELRLPGLPPIGDLTWHADPQNPELRATVSGYDLAIAIAGLDDGRYRSTILVRNGGVDALVLEALLAPDKGGFALGGTTTLLVTPLLPALRALGAIPDDVVALDATLGGPFELAIHADEHVPIAIATQLTLLGELDLRVQPDTRVLVSQAGPIAAAAQYPGLDWTMALPSADLRVESEPTGSQAVSLRNVECRAGIACTLDASFKLGELSYGEASIKSAAVDAKTVRFSSVDGTWQASSENLTVALAEPGYRDWLLPPPTLRGGFSGSNERWSASLRMSTPKGGIDAQARITHSTASGRGSMVIADANLNFDKQKLSQLVRKWPFKWDVAAGTWQVMGRFDWHDEPAGPAYEVQTAHAARLLAGHFGDTAFVGLDTGFDIAFDSQTAPTVSPATLQLALLDVGFAIERINADYTAHIDAPAIDVASLSMELLGGRVTADPFRYDFESESNSLLLRAHGIQLPLMVALADLDSIDISGSVSGELPVVVRGEQVMVDKGRLRNDPPGGAIRYRSGVGIADDTSQLGIVSRTLRNFEFEVLTSDVDYRDNGDLVLQMRLTGVNPDVDATQPVILNLGVENNIPQMLRSLQAARSIEDVLEKRLSK